MRTHLTALLVAILASQAVAQFDITGFTPVRHGMVSPVNAPIRMDFDKPVDRAAFHDAFSVFGRWSGAIPGTIDFSNDDRTAVYRPHRNFSAGDLVTVNISGNLHASDGTAFRTGGYSHQYWTRAGRIANLDFEQVSNQSTGNPSRPYGGVATDLDNDGWLDITTVNEDTADLRIFRNKKDGTGYHDFDVATTAVGNRASPSESADFNGDGNADITVANIDDDTISVVLGNGDGTFMPQQVINVGDTPRGIAVLDIDGDGDTDIVNTNRSSNNLSIHVNNGNGVFGTPTTMNGGVAGEWSLMAGDMNNDGLLDLVTGGGSAAQIRVLTSNGDGTFNSETVQNTGGRSWQIMLGDVNGDGNLDISSANAQNNNGAILLGNGDGTLQPATTYDIRNMGNGNNGFPLATDLGDLDGDGDLDWVTSSFQGDWIVLENDGDGNFTFLAEIEAPVAASCSIFHDYDNDGDLDLGLVDEIENVFILSQNTGTRIALGDFDLDGDLDLADIDALTAAAANGEYDPGFDLNGDGVLNHLDLGRWLAVGGAANLASGNGYLPGDANLDGVVDTSDFAIWNANKFTLNTAWSSGNFNLDQSIDVPDFNAWSSNKFQSSDRPQSVPEPAAAMLWLVGMTLCGLKMRRA